MTDLKMDNKKVLAISQPRYIPSLNYIHRMVLADEFVYLDNVQYTSRDWENRNKIKTPQGETWLSVSIEKGKRERLIKDTLISKSDLKWPVKHLRAIELNYSKAPFFHEIFPFMKEMYESKWNRLMDLNIHFVDFVVDYLGIKCDFFLASKCEPSGVGQELLVDICKKRGATIYLSGPLGNNYISNKLWEDNGIKLVFHDYQYPTYKQRFEDFTPWLSILDLLMNHGKDSIGIICKEQQIL